jgi:hypothetical protein
MSKQSSDLLWSILILVLGIISLLTSLKKDPNYKDIYLNRLRGLLFGGLGIVGGIYAICKVLWFTNY